MLRGIDIEIEPGKITALIGPSGSGKTTLLRTLALLEKPDSGRIWIDGASYNFPLSNGTKIRVPYPRVTVVFQQLFLWPHLTLRQNITLPLRNRNGHGQSAYVDELLAIFGMENFIDRYPNEVSLGQRQRAALVRALALNPEYILLDEITSSLDVEQVSAILSHLQMLRDKGIGILIITHLIGFARRAADQIVFQDGGRILERGGKEMLDNPKQERVRRFLSIIESAS